MRCYYDFEFIEDGATIAPISIGMVTDDGGAYYAVFADMPTDRILGHPWLMANVVPHLPSRRSSLHSQFALDRGHPDVMSREQIARDVREFLTIAGGGERVDLWAWCGAYDHVALAQLFGTMMDRPKSMPMHTNDLQQELDRLRIGDDELPAQEGTAHRAIDDAHWLRDTIRWIETRTEATT